MVELVDTSDSKSDAFNGMRVRFPLGANGYEHDHGRPLQRVHIMVLFVAHCRGSNTSILDPHWHRFGLTMFMHSLDV